MRMRVRRAAKFEDPVDAQRGDREVTRIETGDPVVLAQSIES